MKIINITLFIFLIAVTIISCEKVDVQKAETDKPIVEGYLIPGQKITLKVVKELVYKVDTASKPIENLEITIFNSENSELLQYTDSGNYISKDMVVKENETYRFEFKYQEKIVSAESKIPAKPNGLSTSSDSITVPVFSFSSGVRPTFPDPVEITWNNQLKDYYLVVVKNIETDTVSISFGEDFPGGNGGRNPGRRIFRNEPAQTDQYELNFMNFSYLGRHDVILIHLNADYAALYKQNGNSSINLTAPISNIQNGLGIFTGLNSDTLTIDILQ